jgi:hypothetical protein
VLGFHIEGRVGKEISERTLDIDGRRSMDSGSVSGMVVANGFRLGPSDVGGERGGGIETRHTCRAESRASSTARDSEVEALAVARASLTSATTATWTVGLHSLALIVGFRSLSLAKSRLFQKRRTKWGRGMGIEHGSSAVWCRGGNTIARHGESEGVR